MQRQETSPHKKPVVWQADQLVTSHLIQNEMFKVLGKRAPGMWEVLTNYGAEWTVEGI